MNQKAIVVATMPALMIPVERALQAHHAPDWLIGTFMGVTIGIMLLLLVVAARERRCDRTSL